MSEKNSMSKEKRPNASRKSGGLPLHKITHKKSHHLEEKYKEMRYCIPPKMWWPWGKHLQLWKEDTEIQLEVFFVASKNHNRKVV